MINNVLQYLRSTNERTASVTVSQLSTEMRASSALTGSLRIAARCAALPAPFAVVVDDAATVLLASLRACAIIGSVFFAGGNALGNCRFRSKIESACCVLCWIFDFVCAYSDWRLVFGHI